MKIDLWPTRELTFCLLWLDALLGNRGAPKGSWASRGTSKRPQRDTQGIPQAPQRETKDVQVTPTRAQEEPKRTRRNSINAESFRSTVTPIRINRHSKGTHSGHPLSGSITSRQHNRDFQAFKWAGRNARSALNNDRKEAQHESYGGGKWLDCTA